MNNIRLADKFIQKISKNVFIPIMFGVGIKSLNDINKLLKLKGKFKQLSDI